MRARVSSSIGGGGREGGGTNAASAWGAEASVSLIPADTAASSASIIAFALALGFCFFFFFFAVLSCVGRSLSFSHSKQLAARSSANRAVAASFMSL